MTHRRRPLRRVRAGRALHGVLALAATVVVGGVVRADAPPGQYATFGRTSLCITDNFTQLTWLRTPLADTLSFSDAATQCGALGPGWRVPSVNELETLVDENPHYELEDGVLLPKAIDANAFPGTPVTIPYWTSSVQANATTSAWAVSFQDGSTLTALQTEPQEVRCVVFAPSSRPAVCE